VFNDITTGDNVFTGEVGSTTDFQAAPGYDLATGLGSVNIANLISKWKTAGITRGTASATTLASATTFPITHGSPVSLAITVAPQTGTGTPTGDVSVVLSPTGSTVGTPPAGIALATFTLSDGSVTSSTSTLPGGTYALRAHYEGDGTFLPSDSAPFGPITVSPESSQTQVLLVLLNPTTGAISFPTTLPYGSNDAIRVNIASTNVSAPCAKNAIGDFGCPTGTVTITKNTGSPLDGGTFTLNSLGYTEDQAISSTLAPGSYNMQASYSGDLSFNASSGSEAITITPASTTAVLGASATSISTTGSTTLTAGISTQSFGNPPTGNVAFTLNGNTQLGSVVVTGGINANTGFAQATAVLNVSASQLQSGSNSIVATYNGDANYSASPASAAVIVSVGGTASFSLALAPSTVTIPTPGASGHATLTVTALDGFGGTIPLSAAVCSGLPSESSCSFSSASITGSGSVVVTISTTSAGTLARRIRPFGRWTSLGSFTLALLLGTALLLRIRPLRRRLAFTFAFLTAASLLAMGGCGGGGNGGGSGIVSNPGTPVGNDTSAVITLASGSVTNSITFSINVE
jgi:trimeric autotransporter adhesin